MRLNRVLAAASVLAVASAASLRADQKNFTNYCTPGAVKACFSIQVITTVGGPGTLVTIRVRNLQGGLYDNTGGSILHKIGIVAPSPILGATLVSVTGVSGATTTGAAGSQWSLKNTLGGGIEFGAGTPNDGNGGIRGCSVPNGPAVATYFTTCTTGWVEISFTTTTVWSANNSEVAALTDHIVNGNGAFECDSDGSGAPARSQCVVATPEPITMILLGSGLASMGGFGLVRRRKGSDVISD